MSKKTLKLVASILALVMVSIAIVGCGGSSTNQTQSSTTAATAGTTTSATTKTPVPAGKEEIIVWNVWTGAGGESLQEIANKFNSSQDKYVANMTFSGSYAETLAKYQATTAGNRPDVVMVSTEYVAFFKDNPEYFVPVQKYIDEDKYDISDIVTNLRVSYSDENDKLMCMPLGNTVVGFFYNEDVLAKAGIDPLKDLNSYEEIAVACDKLKANGVEFPFMMTANSIYYTFPITAEGLEYVDNNNGKDALCTTSLIDKEPLASVTTKFFQFLKDLQAKGQLAPIDLAANDARQMFIDGKIALLTSTCSGLRGIGDLAEWKINFGFHPSPTVSKGAKNYGQCTGGGALFISNNNNPAKERGAWEFMKFMLEPENTSAFAMATGYLPTTKSGFETAEYKKFVEEYFPTATISAEAQNNTAEDCFNAYLPMFGDVHQIVIDYIKKVINESNYAADKATKDMAASINEAIELYRLSKK